MARCSKCQSLMEQSVKPEHVEDLGGVVVKVLNAVVVRRCPNCAEELTAIPDLEGLARATAIARALNPARLGGKEVRFLRRVLDMTQKEFAEKMDLTPEHVSRLENGKTENGAGEMSEKLIRHNVCALLADGIYNYDAKAITNMRLRSAPDEGMAPLEFVRVIAHTGEGGDATWSEAA